MCVGGGGGGGGGGGAQYMLPGRSPLVPWMRVMKGLIFQETLFEFSFVIRDYQ